MTLILSVNGRETIWMLSDRRLTYSNCPPRDNARKLMFLETQDGVAILGYAGLGATIHGTEPSDWMSRVLQGRNFPLEQCLSALTDALRRELPKHLRSLSPAVLASHHIVIPAFLGNQIHLYTIDLALAPGRLQPAFRYTRHVASGSANHPPRTPRLGLAGSGAACLMHDKRWTRHLLRLVSASDAGKISPVCVADKLASINELASQNTRDGSVGSSSIVAWRHRKLGVHKGGGAHQFYEGKHRTQDSASLPAIANGMDMPAIIGAIIPHAKRWAENIRIGGSPREFDFAGLNTKLAKIPGVPDETLK